MAPEQHLLPAQGGAAAQLGRGGMSASLGEWWRDAMVIFFHFYLISRGGCGTRYYFSLLNMKFAEAGMTRTYKCMQFRY
jgi:hypothetical protein